MASYTLYFRIEELSHQLKRKGEAEIAIEEQARQQEISMMELEASLSQVKDALLQKQLEVSLLISASFSRPMHYILLTPIYVLCCI